MLKKPISAADNLWNTAKPIIRAAFPYTIPVLAGYGCLGFTYGVLMSASGFSPSGDDPIGFRLRFLYVIKTVISTNNTVIP